MVSMVEKVARRMATANGHNPDKLSHNSFEWWRHYVPMARAAIEAMREPTAGMVQAGKFTLRDIPLGNGTNAKGLALGDDPVNSYVKMIDAALAPAGDNPS